jgi:hypothetical protein
MTIWGASISSLLDFMASSTRTKSPAELTTTADRIALAPLGTPTKDCVRSNSSGISHTVALVERLSPLLLLARSTNELRAIFDVGTNALVRSGDNATAIRAAEDVGALMMFEQLMLPTRSIGLLIRSTYYEIGDRGLHPSSSS